MFFYLIVFNKSDVIVKIVVEYIFFFVKLRVRLREYFYIMLML